MHDYGPVIITFVVVLSGILFNRKDVADLKSDMNRQFDEIKGHLVRIDEDLKRFHGTDKELEGRVNEISARIK